MIGVVILNYNTYEETTGLVEALQRQTIAPHLSVVVVDNASPNGSFERLLPLEQRFERVHVLQTGRNSGYAQGNNFGLHYLERNIRPEYVAILNNDVTLPDDCFEKLAAKYRQLDNPCIIAPVQLDTCARVSIMGRLPRFGDDLLDLSFLYRRLRRHRVKPKDNTGIGAMKVDVVSGSFMFASLEKFRSIGYFYPGTFLYAEERFVAWATKAKGYANYLVLDQTYVHRHGLTVKALHDTCGMFKMSYQSRLEYTRVCRKYGKAKALVLKPLMRLSLLEIGLVNFIRGNKHAPGNK
ncbi:glycosyltransferase family 2 protein [uncultured Alistipes sp.]|jgi:glycosyltransferase, family 2|uniref:glycosyltransferase n=1 Tax=uncultured Alistipes sp. TaxID=538949 RepID=UPI0025FF4825|nr:glycosyltransferase family 2 protein [uncultured Alistipes sp.]